MVHTTPHLKIFPGDFEGSVLKIQMSYHDLQGPKTLTSICLFAFILNHTLQDSLYSSYNGFLSIPHNFQTSAYAVPSTWDTLYHGLFV